MLSASICKRDVGEKTRHSGEFCSDKLQLSTVLKVKNLVMGLLTEHGDCKKHNELCSRVLKSRTRPEHDVMQESRHLQAAPRLSAPWPLKTRPFLHSHSFWTPLYPPRVCSPLTQREWRSAA